MKSIISKFLKKIRNRKTISIIRINGIIGAGIGMRSAGVTLDDLEQQIESAFSSSKLTAVILKINSPGGSPVQSELIFNKIRSLAEEKNVKIYAFAEDMAASGGYWIACAADEIYAAKNSIIGSIGVVAAGFGFEHVIEKFGIKRRIYTQGSSKSILDPFTPEKESDVTILKQAQACIYDNFKEIVTSRRQIKEVDMQEIFSGAFWASADAIKLGLIDGVGNIHDFIKSEFGKNVKIKKYNFRQSWLKSKFSMLFDVAVEKVINKIQDNLVHSKFF